MKNVLVNGGLRVHTVPKVASTSQSAAMLWKRPCRAYPDEQNDDYKFMAVRHPFDRLVSAWIYFTPAERLRHSQVFKHAVWPDMPFGAFVELVCQHPMKDKHTATQVRFKGGVEIDDLVRLEDMAPRWNALVGRFPVATMAHRNKTDHKSWPEYFTPALKAIAGDAYSQDIELYEGITKWI